MRLREQRCETRYHHEQQNGERGKRGEQQKGGIDRCGCELALDLFAPFSREREDTQRLGQRSRRLAGPHEPHIGARKGVRMVGERFAQRFAGAHRLADLGEDGAQAPMLDRLEQKSERLREGLAGTQKRSEFARGFGHRAGEPASA